MYITCYKLYLSGKLPERFSCCESCHSDADDGYGDLIELTEEDAGIEDTKYKVIGEMCCSMSHTLEDLGEEGRKLVKELYEQS